MKIVPLDADRHAGKGLRKGVGYGFAAAQAVVPLVLAESAQAAVALPIAFMEHSGGYLPVAVMSPLQGRNLFVAPTGRWLGLYLPAALRSHPFQLAQFAGSDQLTLCIDEDSGLIADAAASTNVARFFEDDGSPSAALNATLEFLRQVEQSRSITKVAVSALAEARLIQPWSLVVPMGGQQITVNGLFRIDEPALNAVDGETFLKLRAASALALAYTQLISMQTVVAFGQMAALQEQIAQQSKPLPAASALFTTDDTGTIKFN